MSLREKHGPEIDTIISRYAQKRSAVLPILYIAQDEYGHLTDAAIREVAQLLDLPPTDVFEVVGFYTLFYNKPVGKWVLQVCDDVPCCFVGDAGYQSQPNDRRRHVYFAACQVPGRLRSRAAAAGQPRLLPQPYALNG